MANLIDLQTQIEALQKQADALRTKEFASTVAEIRAKMAAFGITAKDLATPKKGRGKLAAPAKTKAAKVKIAKRPKSGAKVEAKFKGPNGESWSGRGLMPKWLKALIAQGRTKEEFSVQATPT